MYLAPVVRLFITMIDIDVTKFDLDRLHGLFRECRPRLLVVTDGSLDGGSGGFGLSRFIATLQATTIHGMTPIVVHRMRQVGPAVDGAFDDLQISRFDVLFLFGFETTGAALGGPALDRCEAVHAGRRRRVRDGRPRGPRHRHVRPDPSCPGDALLGAERDTARVQLRPPHHQPRRAGPGVRVQRPGRRLAAAPVRQLRDRFRLQRARPVAAEHQSCAGTTSAGTDGRRFGPRRLSRSSARRRVPHPERSLDDVPTRRRRRRRMARRELVRFRATRGPWPTPCRRATGSTPGRPAPRAPWNPARSSRSPLTTDKSARSGASSPTPPGTTTSTSTSTAC